MWAGSPWRGSVWGGSVWGGSVWGFEAQISALFAAGEQGAWYDPSDLSTLYQDSAGTTPVTALGQPVGRMLDKSGRGNHASQPTATNRPILPAAGYRLRSDWVDDVLTNSAAITDGEMWVGTPWGHYKSALRGTAKVNLPLNDATGVLMREGALNAAQIASIERYFGTDRKYMIALSPNTTVAYLRIYSGGAGTDLLFAGANGATVSKTLSLNSNTTFDVSADGLTAPVAVVWPATIGAALTQFYCYANQLTGSIPSLTANTALMYFSCRSNQLTGSIPSLTANTALTEFSCYSNQLTGSIPSLTANTALTQFYCYANQLTGYSGGGVSATLGDFQAQDNLLSAAAVNAILADFVAANRTTGTRVLNLGGTGNAAPTGQGLTDKAALVSRGWTVTTN